MVDSSEKDPKHEGEPAENSDNNHASHKNDIEASAGLTQGSSDTDPYIVDWDGPNDPHNPFNWTAFKKYRQLTGMAFNTFLT